MSEISMGNLYDMNKQISKQMPIKTAPEILSLYPKLNHWFTASIDKYAMLLCHEQRDYTIFHKTSGDFNMAGEATKALFECIDNRGDLVSFDPADSDAWEIWIRTDEDDYCYYLFNYDNAVIEV